MHQECDEIKTEEKLDQDMDFMDYTGGCLNQMCLEEYPEELKTVKSVN